MLAHPTSVANFHRAVTCAGKTHMSSFPSKALCNVADEATMFRRPEILRSNIFLVDTGVSWPYLLVKSR